MAIVIVELLSRVWLFATQGIAAHQVSLSFTISRSLPKLMSFESVMPSNHLILCCPFSSCPWTIPASESFPMSQLFAWGGKYRQPYRNKSIGVSASASSEHPGLISFRIDWCEFLAVQGTFKNLLQHHSSKASIQRHSAFFTVQLSHPYMTVEKP